MRILVVDDDADFAATLASGLRRDGFEVAVASEGNQIRAAVKKAAYDLVLLDINIGGLDDVPPAQGGRSVLVNIMTYNPSARVVAVSGVSSGEQVADMLRLGAVDFVEKPASLEERARLKDRVMARLEGPNLVHDREALRETILHLLWHDLAAGTPRSRGIRLELLAYHLFASVPGFSPSGPDIVEGPDEIDLRVVNSRTEAFWIRRGDVFLVECKNLSIPVARKELDILLSKVQRSYAKCDVAFFLSPSGFSSAFKQAYPQRSRNTSVVVCLDAERIGVLVRSQTAARAALLERFVDAPLP